MRRFSVSKTVLLIICLMYLILYVDRVNISTAAPLIKADLGSSNTQLGLAFSAFAYPYALFQLIGGYFGDKFGARLDFRYGSIASLWTRAAHFRSTPINRHAQRPSACFKGAMWGLMHRSKQCQRPFARQRFGSHRTSVLLGISSTIADPSKEHPAR